MREFRLINEAIKKFELDLHGLTVLTEAASGNYVWTPLIAALAGAKVYAFSRDSEYATFGEVEKQTKILAGKLGVIDRLSIHNHLNKVIIHSADIITNTGFLRPLNKEKLQYCKENVVIPLMYETWEFRESDIDLKYCRNKKIPVLGTNEFDPRLKTIEYLGTVAKKAMLLNNLEVFQTKVVILGFGKFAEAIYNSLKNEVDFVDIWNEKRQIIYKKISEIDAIIIADHQTKKLYVGYNGLISPKIIKNLNPDIRLIHICGNIDIKSIRNSKLANFPKEIAKMKWMSLTTDFVGPKPVIDLHTAGLKVGEKMFRNLIKYQNYNKAITISLNDKLVQNFS